jgi:hypothetical protein
LRAAQSWPDWKELSDSAGRGNAQDVIHYLNQLAMSLRAVVLQRDASASSPSVTSALDQLLVIPVKMRRAQP